MRDDRRCTAFRLAPRRTTIAPADRGHVEAVRRLVFDTPATRQMTQSAVLAPHPPV
ncbi:hypothetical protein [Streptomyces sp. NPDC048710]|uniref:hypothetical protein n=1 Tax=unclassified Streptomyces TaxID=2593676 RepID=UPI0037240D49